MDKIIKINDFINKKYFPILRKYGLSDEELMDILQKIVNKLNDKSYLEKLDVDDSISLVNLCTDNGLNYKKENKKLFGAINSAFVTSTICAIEGYDTGNESTLPFISDRISYDLGNTETRKYFFKGDGEGFYNYLNKYLPEHDIEHFDMICDLNMSYKKYENYIDRINFMRKLEQEGRLTKKEEKPSLSEQKEKLLIEKKEAVSSLRDQIRDLNINDIKANKTL